MVVLKHEGRDLVIEMQGVHSLLAFKASLRVPIASIREAKKAKVAPSLWGRGLRLPGTYVPWVINAGSYYWGDWHFWDVSDPNKTIEITPGEGKYSRIFVDVEDPEEALGFIEALKRTKA